MRRLIRETLVVYLIIYFLSTNQSSSRLQPMSDSQFSIHYTSTKNADEHEQPVDFTLTIELVTMYGE